MQNDKKIVRLEAGVTEDSGLKLFFHKNHKIYTLDISALILKATPVENKRQNLSAMRYSGTQPSLPSMSALMLAFPLTQLLPMANTIRSKERINRKFG